MGKGAQGHERLLDAGIGQSSEAASLGIFLIDPVLSTSQHVFIKKAQDTPNKLICFLDRVTC